MHLRLNKCSCCRIYNLYFLQKRQIIILGIEVRLRKVPRKYMDVQILQRIELQRGMAKNGYRLLPALQKIE
jgi:hypothetical protein